MSLMARMLLPGRAIGQALDRPNRISAHRALSGLAALTLALASTWAPAYGQSYLRGNIESEWLHQTRPGHDALAINALYERADHLLPDWQFKLAVQARIGGGGHAFDIRELLLTRKWPGGSVAAGLGREFWGTTESRHLVNVLNPSDLRFASDGLTKLGQPMLAFSQRQAGILWKAYLLPCYRQQAQARTTRQYGSADGGGQPVFLPLRCGQLDRAARAELNTGALDLGLAWFSGRARQPQGQHNQPTYPDLQRWSIDGQLTLASWLWKLEAIRERAPAGIRHAHVTGFEYTFAQLATSADVGILYENLHESACPVSTCAHVVGVRIGLNDTATSQLLVTRLVEKKGGRSSYLLKAGRRLSDHASIRIEAQKNDSAWQIRSSIVFGF